jgi:trehalose 6-phosphate synthase
MWFGWNGNLSDADAGDPEIQIRDGVTYASLELRRQEFEPYYNGFANGSLWPLFHYAPNRFRFCSEERDAYEQINRVFARKLLPLLRPDDLIWVHDYHLIPLGARLRELGVRAPIGFFLHIPFPHIEMLRVLPCHAELVRDLAGYDLLGFQTQSDLASFQAAAERLFGHAAVRERTSIKLGERTVCAGVFPIGIDVDAVQQQAAVAGNSAAVRRMVDSLHGRKLMIGVDRLDYSKGLVERFAAYEQFLECFPENSGRVTYLQIAPLSRNDVQSYVEIRRALEQAAGRTNGRFADTDWTPIRYVNRNLPHGELMGFLRAASVGLVTALRDGMNLVAKEYVAAQDPEDPGVLVLSGLTGAACELDAAVIVNPHDARAVGHAIQSALHMSLAERRERHSRLMTTLRRHDIAAWTDSFIATLDAAGRAAHRAA